MTSSRTATVNDAATSGNAYRSHVSKHGDWFVVQQQLTSRNGDASRGLNVAANATFHDKNTNFIDNYQSLMFVYKGPFDARPKDDVGIGFARIHVNDDVKKNAELTNAANGVTDYDDPLFSPLREHRIQLRNQLRLPRDQLADRASEPAIRHSPGWCG